MNTNKTYNVIDRVQESFFDQWISSYVQEVLRSGNIDADTVEIIALDGGKRFVLKVDGKDYVIRNWKYNPIEFDEQDRLCSYHVEYTLFDTLDFDVPVLIDGKPTWNEGVVSGVMHITWNNDILSEDEITYRHEIEEVEED